MTPTPLVSGRPLNRPVKFVDLCGNLMNLDFQCDGGHKKGKISLINRYIGHNLSLRNDLHKLDSGRQRLGSHMVTFDLATLRL